MCTENWTMSNERAFIENLLCSRFNFFLVFFSLVVGGALTTDNPDHVKIVLSAGALISVLFAGTIARSQQKLNIILNDHLLQKEGHPVKTVNDACEGKGISMRNWIGYGIPLICCLILITGAISAWFGWPKP